MSTLCKPAVAVPEHLITLEKTLALCQEIHADHPRLELALRLLKNTGVQTRYVVQPIEDVLRHPGFERRNAVYIEQSKRLTPPVIREALANAGVRAAEIDAIIYVSSTGFMMPSMTAFLINHLGFRSDTRQIPIAQMGCAGGG
ncbi:MAG: type III polyketide synthase, partial [Bdellovibrionota bacterium]